MNTITNKLSPVEIDDKEVPVDFEDQLTIENHWNMSRWVVLKWKDLNITFVASQLKNAIDNATNHL